MKQSIALGKIHGFVDDLEATANQDVDLNYQGIESILMAGMGGSAISSTIVANLCSSTVDIPISVIKTTRIPNWVNEKTLCIISSYSGNTEETLEMYKRAMDRGAKMVVITSGGKLMELARSNNIPLFLIPKGFEPRYTAGFMIGHLASILKSLGYCELSRDIMDCIGRLRNYRNSLEAPGSLPRTIADGFSGYVFVLCTHRKYKSIALRWKAQFNENSKMIAFDTDLSQLSSLKGRSWTNYKGNTLKLLVIAGEEDFSDGGLIPNVLDSFDNTGLSFQVIALYGETYVERILRAIILGDYITVLIAEQKRIDPEVTTVISELKRRIRSKDPFSAEEEKE